VTSCYKVEKRIARTARDAAMELRALLTPLIPLTWWIKRGEKALESLGSFWRTARGDDQVAGPQGGRPRLSAHRRVSSATRVGRIAPTPGGALSLHKRHSPVSPRKLALARQVGSRDLDVVNEDEAQ